MSIVSSLYLALLAFLTKLLFASADTATTSSSHHYEGARRNNASGDDEGGMTSPSVKFNTIDFSLVIVTSGSKTRISEGELVTWYCSESSHL